ncbi:hypothetical protein ABEI56_05330 [Peribacillus castrilensis]|uniref:hypothetical protein n=1 Tax=Peribacillus castrilensis TaxID=2897690 RepID=UPI003D2ADBA4
MANRKVKIVQGLSSPDFVFNPGDEETLDSKFAKQLVENGIAEYTKNTAESDKNEA